MPRPSQRSRKQPGQKVSASAIPEEKADAKMGCCCAIEKDKVVKNKRWKSFGGCIAVLALLGTAAQAYYARQGLIASNRAWLYPENFTIALDNGVFSAGKVILIQADTRNIGKEPALNVLFSHYEHGFVHDITGPNLNIPRDDMCAGYKQWMAKSVETDDSFDHGVVFPEQKLEYHRIFLHGVGEDSEANIDAVKPGRALFWLKDCIAYTTYGDRHVTPFCIYYVNDPAANGLVIRHCPQGNDPS